MTPQEIERGRALLAKATKAPWEVKLDAENGKDEAWGYWHAFGPLSMCASDRSKIPAHKLDDVEAVLWLRNHADELLADSAALADARLEAGQRIVRLEGELREERAHADRLVEHVESLIGTAESYAIQTYDRSGVTRRQVEAARESLADHAARRKEADNAAASE